MTDDTQDEFTVVSDNAEATMEVMELLADRDDITVNNRKYGDSSSSVKVESDSLSNGGEPPTAAFIVESVDHDFKLVWNKEDSATGKVEDELVRREDHEERVQELNARWAGRLEDAVKNERERIREKIEDVATEIAENEDMRREFEDGDELILYRKHQEKIELIAEDIYKILEECDLPEDGKLYVKLSNLRQQLLNEVDTIE